MNTNNRFTLNVEETNSVTIQPQTQWTSGREREGRGGKERGGERRNIIREKRKRRKEGEEKKRGLGVSGSGRGREKRGWVIEEGFTVHYPCLWFSRLSEGRGTRDTYTGTGFPGPDDP